MNELNWIQILAESFFTFNILDAFLSYKKKLITFEVELRNDLTKNNLQYDNEILSRSKMSFMIVYFSFLTLFAMLFYYFYFNVLPIKISVVILCFDSMYRILNNWIPKES